MSQTPKLPPLVPGQKPGVRRWSGNWHNVRPQTHALMEIQDGSTVIGTRRKLRFIGITGDITEVPSEDLIEIDLSSASGADEKVKVTSNDTTADYLLNKLAAGAGISITELNNGANEDAQIAIDDDDIPYTPATLGDWNSSADPGDVDDALDQLASRVKTIETGGGGGHTIEENGTPLTARTVLNFQDGLVASDDGSETDVNADYAGTAEIADLGSPTEAAGTSPKLARGDHVHAIKLFGSWSWADTSVSATVRKCSIRWFGGSCNVQFGAFAATAVAVTQTFQVVVVRGGSVVSTTTITIATTAPGLLGSFSSNVAVQDDDLIQVYHRDGSGGGGDTSGELHGLCIKRTS